VTRLGDSKADPNIETLTYGLFSRCDRAARSGIVKHGWRYLFFVTNRGGPRFLTGFYLVRWYATLCTAAKDFCLAADEGWFVEDPIPLADVDAVCSTDLDRQWRNCRRLDSHEACKGMESLLRARPNGLEEYLAEVDRLERFNLMHGGFRYFSGKVKVKKAFSWGCKKAKCILGKAEGNRS